MKSMLRSAIRAILPIDTFDALRNVQRKREITQKSRDLGRIDNVLKALESLEKISGKDYIRLDTAGLTEIATAPKGVGVIEINDSCNIDCLMCNTSLATRPKGLMQLDLFERIVSELASTGTKTVSLHTIGDPLANKKLPQYLEILRSHGVHVGAMSTNALRMDRHIDTLFEYRDIIDLIWISIDGSSKWVYEKIRKGGYFDKLHANLLAFTKRNNAHSNPYPISVNCVVSLDNYHELAYLPMVFGYLTTPGQFNFGNISGLSADHTYFNEAKVFDDYYLHVPCGHLWDSPHIHKDGNLSLCSRDYNGDLVFGNINDGSIEEQFNGEIIRSMRRSHLKVDVKSLPKLCQGCITADSRIDTIVNGVIHYYFEKIGSQPAVLQNCLNEMAPLLKARKYSEVRTLIENLS